MDLEVKEMSGMFGVKVLAMEAMRVAPGALGLKTPGMAFEANLLVAKTPATRRMPGVNLLAMQATAT